MSYRDYDLRAYRLVDGVIREIPLPARELFDGKAFDRRCDAEDARQYANDGSAVDSAANDETPGGRMDRTQARFERFAQLRAAHPGREYAEIMDRIYEEELDDDQRAHDEMLDSVERERERA